jgi:hypothetical protein
VFGSYPVQWQCQERTRARPAEFQVLCARVSRGGAIHRRIGGAPLHSPPVWRCTWLINQISSSGAGCAASSVHYGLDEWCLAGALSDGDTSECKPHLGSLVGITTASLNCTAYSPLTGQARPAGGLTLCCEP